MFFVVLVFTDFGICHAFNANNPQKMFKPSPYMSAFNDVFGTDEEDDKIMIGGFNDHLVEVIFHLVIYKSDFSGVGSSEGMTFILDSQHGKSNQ